MADSEEVLNLRRRARRRLVGATAVVLFLVIVPPLLMDLEPKPTSSNLAVDIPSKDQRATSIVKPAPSASVPAPAAPLPPTGIPKAATLPDPPAKMAATEPPAGKAPPTPAAQSTAADGEGFFIQIGAFNNKDRAQEIRGKVALAGVRVYAETVKVEGVEQVRLRAGPYPNKESADNAHTRLESLGRDLGFKPGPVRLVEKRA